VLILTLRCGEKIVIGHDAEISTTVLDIKQNQIKLGISAPEAIGIYRAELLEENTLTYNNENKNYS